MWKTLLDWLWPKTCINCNKPGTYLCQDCLAMIDILQSPDYRSTKHTDAFYCATTYNNKLVKKAIALYKYSYIKELSFPLSFLIISHFHLSNKQINPSSSIFCAVPLHKKRLKRRGFNQAEEIAKNLSLFFGAPYIERVIIKTKNTPSQTDLNKKERQQNVEGAFSINPQKRHLVKHKEIFLVDDVLTTGATMEECARVLKQNRASNVWGVVVARD